MSQPSGRADEGGFPGPAGWGLDLVTPKSLCCTRSVLLGSGLQEHQSGRLPSVSEAHHAPQPHIYATWSPTSTVT